MSANIDLNSDVVLPELDNDNVAEPVSRVGAVENETLEESKRSESRIDKEVEVEEKKLESGEKKNEGFDLEVEIASFDRENDGENERMDIDGEIKNSEGQTLAGDGDDAPESEDSDMDSGSDEESEEDVKVVKKKVKLDAPKPELHVSDLVWGKVTSHPWWPGQIFDSSDATKKAKKYFKNDRYLIGYFGDQTFAWNDASKIKPFRENFAQMVDQSKLEDFHDAVDCALDEVSRRVEFGLGCSCMPDYDFVETQIIVNAGIREECCRRYGGDRFSTVDSFEPLKLVEYVKALAELRSDKIDPLEFTTTRSQLLAYNRWKGYSDLPEFQNLGASLENDAAEVKSSSKPKQGSSAVAENARVKVKTDEQKSTREGKMKSPDNLPRKRKKIYDDMDGVPIKKEKSLADLLAEKRSSSHPGKSKTDSKGITKPLPSPSSKKRRPVSPISDYKDGKTASISDDKHSRSPASEVQGNSSQPKRTFRVGDSILRVASQLSQSGGILKSINGSTQKPANKGKSSSRKPESKNLFIVEDYVPDEMRSQLCLVAKAPLKPCHSSESIVGFFSKFRNFICPDSVELREDEHSSLEHGSIKKEEGNPETETSRSEQADGSRGDDAMNVSVSEEQSSPGNQKEAENSVPQSPKDETAKNEPQPAISLDSDQNPDQQTTMAEISLDSDQNPDQQTTMAENSNDDDNDAKPTALILNFTNLDSVPSVTNLNKIFSKYGLLMESQTEVMKKSRRAKVVFHKSADAEAAFSSAGKYSVFGPSLVSYRLKYMPSKSSKSPNAKKRSRTGSPAADGNTT